MTEGAPHDISPQPVQRPSGHTGCPGPLPLRRLSFGVHQRTHPAAGVPHTQCREVSGRAYSNFSFFKVRDTQTSGAHRTVAFTADSGSATVREVCAACGDMLIDRTEGFPKVVGVVHEAIHPAMPFAPLHHVWADSRLPDTILPSDVKVYAQGAT
ncbi:MAG: GFA family protein [Betaproteobacteria bacterium]